MEAFDEKAIKAHQEQCNEMRKKLNPGPWMDEPDRVNWKSSSLDCMIVRSAWSFHLCGYVGVPKGHPLFGTRYQDVAADVHGGLTYASQCDGAICHKSDEEVWWFGFDCMHYNDFSPYHDSLEYRNFLGGKESSLNRGGKYRTIEYVRQQVEHLARQLQAK